MLALSLGSCACGISPSLLTVPVSSIRKQTLIESGLTPGAVAPPLLPVKAGAHGGAYTDSIWRAGLPKPYGQSRGSTFGGGVVVVVVVSTAAACSGGMPDAVPLPAARNDENTDDWFLSGGASGENALLVWGWSCGGRRMLGRMSVASTSAMTP